MTLPTQQATFKPVDGLKAALMIKSAVALFGPLLFMSWVCAMCLPITNDISDSWFIALAMMAAAWLVCLWIRSRQLDTQIAAMSLSFDDEGVTQRLQSHECFIAWDDLRQARSVKPYGGITVGSVGKIGRARGTKRHNIYLLANAVFGTELGLVGIGTLNTTEDMNRRRQNRVSRSLEPEGVDEETGKAMLALYPQQFQLDWPNDAIGQWIERYRPDLLVQAQEMLDVQKSD